MKSHELKVLCNFFSTWLNKINWPEDKLLLSSLNLILPIHTGYKACPWQLVTIVSLYCSIRTNLCAQFHRYIISQPNKQGVNVSSNIICGLKVILNRLTSFAGETGTGSLDRNIANCMFRKRIECRRILHE